MTDRIENRREETKSNLRYWFNQASEEQITEGLKWYRNANKYVDSLYDKYNGDYERTQIASVISALSPRNKWERNKVDAENVLEAVNNYSESLGGNLGELINSVKVCTFNANKVKAFNIARGDWVTWDTSPKTYAFSRNVGLLDWDYVTVDVWHIRACNTKSHEPVNVRTQVTTNRYDELSDITKEVAEEIGLKGYEFQAVVWVTIRNFWTQ